MSRCPAALTRQRQHGGLCGQRENVATSWSTIAATRSANVTQKLAIMMRW